MSLPQTQCNFELAIGIPGTVAADVPVQAQERLVYSNVAVNGNPNYFGYAYTESTYVSDVESGVGPNSVTVGGTGQFAGILISPKAASSYGGSGGPTSTTYALADSNYGQLGRFGAFFVQVSANANIGDEVLFNTTTGAISTQPQLATFSGYIAATTGVLTVTAMGSGSPSIQVGQPLIGTGVPANTIITGFTSGTNGGAGIYSTNYVQSTAIGSSGTPVTNLQTAAGVASGYARIFNAMVDYFPVTVNGTSGTGIAVIKIIGVNE